SGRVHGTSRGTRPELGSGSLHLKPMSSRIRRLASALLVAAAAVPVASSAGIVQSDLDEFMRRVMERRDDNWRQLQQYILSEREEVQVQGPGGMPLWGERRTYSWYVRDGFFIRSPVEVN